MPAILVRSPRARAPISFGSARGLSTYAPRHATC